MIGKLPTLVAVIAATLLLASITSAKTKSVPKPAQAATFESRVDAYIRQSGYEFHKVKPNSWYLILPGKEMKEMRIILGAGPGSIAMGAVVLPKKQLRWTTDALFNLMKLSYDLNYVRVCIDGDDDLIIMAQRREVWLNVEEFTNTIKLVSEAADRAYKTMRPFLDTP